MLGYAATLSPETAPSEQSQMMKGTIQGEVKKVQPDAVIVEVNADKADKREVRLPLIRPHMSIQSLDSRWYR
jgi:hypothetical protein